VPEVVISKRVLFMDVRGFSNPFRGHSMWFKCLTGKIIVFMVSPSQHIANPDLKAWLKSADLKAVHHNPAVIMDAQDSLYIPVGWIPLWITLPDDDRLWQKRPQLSARGKNAQQPKQAAKEPDMIKEACGVGISLLYEPTLVDSIDHPVRALLHADYVVAKSTFPSKVHEVEGVKEWLQKIPAPGIEAESD